MDPATVISTISAAIGFARELNQVGRTLDEVQWKLKIAELTSALADAKVAATELKDEIEARDRQIAELKAAFAFHGETIERHGYRYEARDGKPIGYPFCPRCIAVEGRFIRMTNLEKVGRPGKCPHCQADYERLTQYLS